MWKFLALTTAVAMVAAAPASAMWFTAQNTKTMACIVSQTKPTSADVKSVEHKTFQEAASALMGMPQGSCKTVTLAAVPSSDIMQMHAQMRSQILAEVKSALEKSTTKAEIQQPKRATTATAPKPSPSKPSTSARAPSGGMPSSGGY